MAELLKKVKELLINNIPFFMYRDNTLIGLLVPNQDMINNINIDLSADRECLRVYYRGLTIRFNKMEEL